MLPVQILQESLTVLRADLFTRELEPTSRKSIPPQRIEPSSRMVAPRLFAPSRDAAEILRRIPGARWVKLRESPDGWAGFSSPPFPEPPLWANSAVVDSRARDPIFVLLANLI